MNIKWLSIVGLCAAASLVCAGGFVQISSTASVPGGTVSFTSGSWGMGASFSLGNGTYYTPAPIVTAPVAVTPSVYPIVTEPEIISAVPSPVVIYRPQVTYTVPAHYYMPPPPRRPPPPRHHIAPPPPRPHPAPRPAPRPAPGPRPAPPRR